MILLDWKSDMEWTISLKLERQFSSWKIDWSARVTKVSRFDLPRNTNQVDDEELINLEIQDRERARKGIENRNKKAYDVYSQDDGASRALLSQYDEVIEGEKQTSFVLGKKGTVAYDAEQEKKKREAEALNLETLDYEKMNEVQDYLSKEEITFKKPKKKKEKKMRKKLKEGGDEDVEMDDAAPVEFSHAKKKIDDLNFVDDDDLQQALSRARKLAVKKPVAAPEDFAKQVLESAKTEEAEDEGADNDLIISTTGEFVRTLETVPVLEREAPVVEQVERKEALTRVQETAVEEVAAAESEPEEGMDVDEQPDEDEKEEEKPVWSTLIFYIRS